MDPKTYSTPFLRRTAFAAGAFIPFWLLAQVVPSQSADTGNEVITLEAFTVKSSSRKDDYIASEAISGTRTGAKILELPYNVQVLTNEFMEDFQVFDENNYRPLQYVPNYAPDNGGRLRGFSPLSLRDGFSRAGPTAISNTQQIEVIMGPQSTLYGHVSPGGLVNYVSKQPKQIQSSLILAARGNYGFERYELESTGPIVPKKFFYLLNVSQINNGSAMQYYYSDVMIYNLALVYKFTANTSISLFGEYQLQDQNGGTSIPDLLVGSRQSGTNPLNRTGGINNGPYLPLAGFNQLGPNQHTERRFENYNLKLEHKFNRVWSGRLSLQYYYKYTTDNRWTSGLSFVPETNRLTSHEPVVQKQEVKTGAVQADLLGQFTTGELKHSLLFAADFTNDKYDNQQWQLPTALRDALPNSQRFIDPFNPDWTNADFTLVTRQTAWTLRDISYHGYSASHRMYALGDRLITLLGARYETISTTVDSPVSATLHGDGSVDAFGYSGGVNYKIAGDRLLAYANYSTSFDTSTTLDQGLNTVQKPTRGRGPEAGFKGMLMADRLGYTISGFLIDQQDVSFTNPAYTNSLAGSGVPQYLAQGEVRVRGGEIALSARVTDEFTLVTNAGYIDAKTTAASNAALVGDRITGVANVTASAAARYSFRRGVLKGLRLGSSVTYTGRRLTDLGTATVLRSSVPAIQNYSAFATYDWKMGRWRHSINLNVQNLFDKFYLTAANKLGDGRNIRVSYRLGF